MEHHLSKLTTSSATSNYVGTLASEGIATYGTLNGQSHLVSSDVTFRDTLVNGIIATEFYGVPIDVIKSLIREHLPEYTL